MSSWDTFPWLVSLCPRDKGLLSHVTRRDLGLPAPDPRGPQAFQDDKFYPLDSIPSLECGSCL